MSKHTPGKWEKDNEGWCIQSDIWENQDLVLAAPELLEALQGLMRAYEAIGGLIHDGTWHSHARAAIEKATK